MDEDDIDADFPMTPTSPVTAFPQSRQPSRRKVVFTDSSKKKIFRYIPPRDEDEQWEIGSDEVDDCEDSASSEDGEADAQWWWDGWEESHDGADGLSTDHEDGEGGDSGADIYVRPGRLRIRRQNAFSVTL